MDAEDALEEITGHQLRMWLAYAELEPVDVEAGLVVSMLANVNRASKDAPYFKPTDFTAFVLPEPVAPPRTPEERWKSLSGQLNLLAAASRARREKREREEREARELQEQREQEQREQQHQAAAAGCSSDDGSPNMPTITPPEPPPVP